MREIEVLLDRFWIIREHDKDLYYQIKDKVPSMKDFIEGKLGYKLIINPTLIKLEKLPGQAEPWMGIEQFDHVREYAFFCLLLVFLEDREKNEQFVLSQLTEFIQSQYPSFKSSDYEEGNHIPNSRQISSHFFVEESIDWTLYSHRKSMVKVLRFAEEMKLIIVNDGDNTGFIEGLSTEVLYESTGLSKYFVRNFTGNLLNYHSVEDLETGEWLSVEQDRGVIRKNRVYRRLVMGPAVYSSGNDDPDYLYIKNFRSVISNDIERAIEGRFHIHKNGAFVLINSDKSFKGSFPNSKAICDIILQINDSIVTRVRESNLQRQIDDVIVMSIAGFENIIESCRDKYISGWSKEYREMSFSKLCEEIISFMKDFSMIQVHNESEVRIMPIVGKIIGKFPENFESW